MNACMQRACVCVDPPEYLENKFLHGGRPEILSEDVVFVFLIGAEHPVLQSVSSRFDLRQPVLALVAAALLILWVRAVVEML